MTRPPAIVRARRGDVHRAAALIATAFHGLDVAAWLVPDPLERQRVLYANFRIFVDHAVDHGDMFVTEDRCAVAVWFPRDRPLPEISDYERRRWLACGPYTDRFEALDAAFDKHHPTAAHRHLAFLAVHPDHQGYGIGTAMLDRYHHRLDRAGLPAYLEASSPASRDLYLRHGYTDHGTPIDLPHGGPRLWPMWRTPRNLDAPSPSIVEKRRQQTVEVVRRYTTGGESIRAIAEHVGISYGLVHKLLVESGTSLRARGAPRRWGLAEAGHT
ncbi:GNAT family N-acetyltransferase [Dactylosporangium sp. NPDC049525]|uniref:GNAT family N-acetyltransferase n=1 Tax=Dactylosporangium sp. NPDC049525 TaxID=3154730 RepID=UPI003414603C